MSKPPMSYSCELFAAARAALDQERRRQTDAVLPISLLPEGELVCASILGDGASSGDLRGGDLVLVRITQHVTSVDLAVVCDRDTGDYYVGYYAESQDGRQGCLRFGPDPLYITYAWHVDLSRFALVGKVVYLWRKV